MFRVPYTRRETSSGSSHLACSLYKPDISGHREYLFQRDDEKSGTDEPIERDRPKDDLYISHQKKEFNTDRLTKSLSQISLKPRLGDLNKPANNGLKEEEKEQSKGPFSKSLFKRKPNVPRSALYRMASVDSEDDNTLETT